MLDVGKPMGTVLFDLKKHLTQLIIQFSAKKLDYYSIRHQELAWFQSYITSRKRISRVNCVVLEIENKEVGYHKAHVLAPAFPDLDE